MLNKCGGGGTVPYAYQLNIMGGESALLEGVHNFVYDVDEDFLNLLEVTRYG